MNQSDLEEQEILRAFESNVLQPIKDMEKHKARHRLAAKNTFSKDARINIRLSSFDLRAIKIRALQEGPPYQTLVSSVLHKYAHGQLVERPIKE
jgi:predicted DNA binding CopG/RHH family protein